MTAFTPRTISTKWGLFKCYPDDIVGNTLETATFWDAHLMPYMDEARDDWGVALDIGAYIGFHAVYLSHMYRRVVAFEPVLQSYELMRQNVEFNAGGANTCLVPLGCYDTLRYLGRAHHDQVGWDPTLTRHAPSVPWFPLNGGDQITVCPADTFVMPTDNVRFVKIDAQGCDLKVLYGLEKTIHRCRPLIVMEWEAGYAAEHAHSWEDVLRWAHTTGYSVERITTDFWDYVLRPL